MLWFILFFLTVFFFSILVIRYTVSDYSLVIRVVLVSVLAVIFELFSRGLGFLGLAHVVVSFWLVTWVVFQTKWIRVHFVSRLLFQYAKHVLPPISDSEREAIEAGTVGFEGDLFYGSPNWDKLINLPVSQLSESELAFINGPVQELCSQLDDWAMMQNGFDLPKSIWDFLKAKRFFAMLIPKTYGGLEFSAYANSTIVQKIATRSPAAAVVVMVPNSLGPAELLLHYGTQQQKIDYLPKLASGEWIPCFGLTSNIAGSDATSIIDQGVITEREHEGQKQLGIVLNFEKRYITLAPVADLIGLAVKIFDPNHLYSDKTDLGISLCLLPAKHPGVETGKRHFPMYQSFMNGPIRGRDVFIPLDWVIGGPTQMGQGWKMLINCLSAGRGISLPALATATAKFCTRTTTAYAKIRKQFGISISRFEGVESKIAEIAGLTYMIEAARIFTLSAIDAGEKSGIMSAMMKCYSTEFARDIVNAAMDVHAGKSLMLGPTNYLARCYLSMPIAITVEGANILTRNLMIFGQGVFRAHPYLKRELMAIEKNDLMAFDQVLTEHLKKLIQNQFSLIVHQFSNGILSDAPIGILDEIRGYYYDLTRLSLSLSIVTDVALVVLGGGLKRREQLSACLADVYGALYFGSSVLKYFQDFGNDQRDLPFVHWTMQRLLYLAQEQLVQFLSNFPPSNIQSKLWGFPVGQLLKRFLFIWGRPFKQPSFELDHQLSNLVSFPSGFRERLTQYVFLPSEKDVNSNLNLNLHIEDDPVYLLEKAFIMATDLRELLLVLDKLLFEKDPKSKNWTLEYKIKKITELQNNTEKSSENSSEITKSDLLKLTEYAKLTAKIVQVDEFDFDFKSR